MSSRRQFPRQISEHPESNTTYPLLSLSGIEKTFGAGAAEVCALKSVDLEIFSSQSLAIMGRSGSGKSTLLNILGLLDSPSSGQYRVAGIETTALKQHQLDQLRANTFGFVFQAFHLVPYLTVAESVAMGVTYHKQPRRQREQRIEELLDKVGMTHRRDAYISTLSGGEKQRTAIARALMRRPKVILADEPTGNLDENTANDVITVFRGVVAEGVALVMVTHDQATAQQMDRTISIRDGLVHK